MIELEFKYKEREDLLEIDAKNKDYTDIWRISNWGWTSDRVEEDLDWTQQCKEGTFKDEDGETSFYVGFERSPATILVRNGDRAYLFDAYDNNLAPYLIFTFDELIEILTQMRDYLKSIGK
jgi:hypothetical protein